MDWKPQEFESYNYDGLWDRLHPQLAAKVRKSFIDVVFAGATELMGADVENGLFSAQTSKIMAGMDEHNPADTLFALTPDGSGPGSVAYSEALAAVEAMLDPETNRPEDPKEW